MNSGRGEGGEREGESRRKRQQLPPAFPLMDVQHMHDGGREGGREMVGEERG